MPGGARRLFVRPLLITVLLASACAGNGVEPTATAMWVFPGDAPTITDRVERTTLTSGAATAGITEMYVSLYRPDRNAGGRQMYDDADVASLVEAAAQDGVAVWAAYGDPAWGDPTRPDSWPGPDCDPESRSMMVLTDVLSFNAEHPGTPISGVVLDVEPPGDVDELDDGGRWLGGMLVFYQCAFDLLGEHTRVGGTLRHYWDDDVGDRSAGVELDGEFRPVSEHLIRLGLDRVVVLAYRDDAAEIASLAAREISQAEAVGAEGLIAIGVETANCAPDSGSGRCQSEGETFYEEGPGALLTAQGAVTHLFDSPVVWGIAIHNYSGSYLGEGWRVGFQP